MFISRQQKGRKEGAASHLTHEPLACHPNEHYWIREVPISVDCLNIVSAQNSTSTRMTTRLGPPWLPSESFEEPSGWCSRPPPDLACLSKKVNAAQSASLVAQHHPEMLCAFFNLKKYRVSSCLYWKQNEGHSALLPRQMHNHSRQLMMLPLRSFQYWRKGPQFSTTLQLKCCQTVRKCQIMILPASPVCT